MVHHCVAGVKVAQGMPSTCASGAKAIQNAPRHGRQGEHVAHESVILWIVAIIGSRHLSACEVDTKNCSGHMFACVSSAKMLRATSEHLCQEQK